MLDLNINKINDINDDEQVMIVEAKGPTSFAYTITQNARCIWISRRLVRLIRPIRPIQRRATVER